MVSLTQSTSGPYWELVSALAAREKVDPSGGQLALLGALAAILILTVVWATTVWARKGTQTGTPH